MYGRGMSDTLNKVISDLEGKAEEIRAEIGPKMAELEKLDAALTALRKPPRKKPGRKPRTSVEA